MALSSPLRILCLHGFRMSAQNMQRQMSGTESNFGSTLADLADFSYIDGAIKCGSDKDDWMPERLRTLFPPPYYEHWNARKDSDGSMIYDHCDTTLANLKTRIAEHGPYDGILGFSQGGSLAHLLCVLQQSGTLTLQQPPLRFAIIISAMMSRHAEYVPLMEAAVQSPLTLPTLVIFGGKDTDVPEKATRQLLTTLDPASTTELFLPDGTHRIPPLSEAEAATCRAFLAAHQRTQEAAVDEDDDDFSMM